MCDTLHTTSHLDRKIIGMNNTMYTCLQCGQLGFYVCPYCLEWWTFDVECNCEYQDDEGFDEGFCHLHCLYHPDMLYCYELLHLDDDYDDDEGIYDV